MSVDPGTEPVDVIVEGWLSLNEAKRHLSIPLDVTAQDTELIGFLRDVNDALRPKIGHVALTAEPVTVYCDGGHQAVRVDELPVGVVLSVTTLGTPVAEANRDTGARGWYLNESEADRRAGIIRHTERFPHGFVKVTYQAGRQTIPGDIRRGALELLRHLWATQRGTGSGDRPGLRGGSSADPSDTGSRGGSVPMGFAFPRRVTELIGPYMLPVAG